MKGLFKRIFSVALVACMGVAALRVSAASVSAETATMRRIINTETHISDLAGAPAVITTYDSADQLTGYASYDKAYRPSNVLVRTDDSLNAVDKANNVLGTLADAYTTNKTNKILTVAQVESETAADAFSAWLTTDDVYDISVMSTSAELVKSVRTAHPEIRGILDYSSATTLDEGEMVATANSSFASIILLNKAQATQERVFFLQARFKAVWVKAEATTAFETYALVSSGAFGIVTEGDSKAVYDCYDAYADGSLARAFNNIGHRGVGTGAPENSMEAYKMAYEGGATMVETDMKVSADGQIFLMHENDLSITTNAPAGLKGAESMTLAEIQQYKITKDANGNLVEGVESEIPTLDDFFGYFKDKEDIVLICEIKTVNTKVVQLLADKVKEYGVQDKVVVIAFSLPMLELMKNTPDTAGIPTAYLNGIYQANAIDGIIEILEHNTTINAELTPLNYFIERNTKNRGFLPYVWTAYTTAKIKERALQGYFGITNDVSYEVANWQKQILPTDGYTTANETSLKTATFEADIVTYDRTTEKAACEVFQYEIHDGYANVILSRTANGYTLYSMPVRVELTAQNEETDDGDSSKDEVGDSSNESTPPPVQSDSVKESTSASSEGKASSSGCGSSLVGGVLSTATAMLFIGVLKKKREN